MDDIEIFQFRDVDKLDTYRLQSFAHRMGIKDIDLHTEEELYQEMNEIANAMILKTYHLSDCSPNRNEKVPSYLIYKFKNDGGAICTDIRELIKRIGIQKQQKDIIAHPDFPDFILTLEMQKDIQSRWRFLRSILKPEGFIHEQLRSEWMPDLIDLVHRNAAKEVAFFDKNMLTQLMQILYKNPKITFIKAQHVNFFETEPTMKNFIALLKNALSPRENGIQQQRQKRLLYGVVQQFLQKNKDASEITDLNLIRQVVMDAAQTGSIENTWSHPFFKNIRSLESVPLQRILLQFPELLKSSPFKVRDNIQIVENICQKFPSMIQFASYRIQNDRDIVIRFLHITKGRTYPYLKPKFKDDYLAIELAVSKNPKNMQYVGKGLDNNRPLLMSILRKNGLALKYCTNDEKLDEELVEIAVASNGLALQFAAWSLQEDETIVMLAIQNNQEAFQYASYIFTDSQSFVYEYVESLRYVSDRLKDNKSFVIEMIHKHPSKDILHNASHRLQDEEDVVMLAVSLSSDNLEFASTRLKNDRQFMEVLFDKIDNYDLDDLFRYLGNELRDSHTFMIKHKGEQNEYLDYASDRLKDDETFIMALLTQIEDNDEEMYDSILSVASKQIRNNRSIRQFMRRSRA